MTIGTTLGADIPVAVDLHALRGTHLGVIANSGAGKSGLIRKVLESTHGEIQQIILDPDDEYYTLREGGDYIIAGGDDGDCPATVANAAQLVDLLLTTSISAVIQLNHLKGDEAQQFVAAFIGALMEAPRAQWRPILLVLDEAHRFIPQDGATAATEAVRDLFARGRKRGFTGVLATQRMASIEKMVTANINNWALGRVGQATDRKVVLDALGFSASSADGKTLMAMEDRVFWVFGRGLGARAPLQMRVADVATTMVESGEAKIATAPAPQKLKKLLQELNKPAPAPTVAAEAAEGPSGPSAAEIEAREKAAYREGYQAGLGDGVLRGLMKAQSRLRDFADDLARPDDEDADSVPSVQVVKFDHDPAQLLEPEKLTLGYTQPADGVYHTGLAGVTIRTKPFDGRGPIIHADPAGVTVVSDGADGYDYTVKVGDGPATEGVKLTQPQYRILDALAWFEIAGIKAPHRFVLAFMAGASATSSGYANNLGAMRTAGVIDYPGAGLVTLSSRGRSAATPPKGKLSNDQVQRAILDKLTTPQRRIMEVLLAGYPDGIARNRLAELAEQSPTSSGYANNLGSLRSLGVLDYPDKGFVVATSLMFPFGRNGR